MSFDDAFLRRVQLSECMAACDPRESLGKPLQISVEIEDLDVRNGDDDDHAVATVGLSFGLYAPESDEMVADLTATFRLYYRSSPLGDEHAQRRFACTRALADAWPVWRGWVDDTLARMGLAPAPLPWQVPPQVVEAGPEAFDLTRKVADREAKPRT